MLASRSLQLFVDFLNDFLRIGQAGAALRFATERGIGAGRALLATAGNVPKLVLSDRIAAADDHDSEI